MKKYSARPDRPDLRIDVDGRLARSVAHDRHRVPDDELRLVKGPGTDVDRAADGCLTQRIADRRTGPNLTVARVGAIGGDVEVATGGAVSSGKRSRSPSRRSGTVQICGVLGPLALPHQLSMALTVVTEESFSTPAVLLPDRSLK